MCCDFIKSIYVQKRINKGSGNRLLHTTSATHTHRAANGRTVTNCHSMANKTIS